MTNETFVVILFLVWLALSFGSYLLAGKTYEEEDARCIGLVASFSSVITMLSTAILFWIG